MESDSKYFTKCKDLYAIDEKSGFCLKPDSLYINIVYLKLKTATPY